MTTLRDVLKTGRRKLLANGWAGKLDSVCSVVGDCRTERGTWCEWNDEAVYTFGVWGALCSSQAPRDLVIAAFNALEAVATPKWVAENDFIRRFTPADFDAEWLGRNPAIAKMLLAHHRATEAEGLRGLDAWLSAGQWKSEDVWKLFDAAIGKAGWH